MHSTRALEETTKKNTNAEEVVMKTNKCRGAYKGAIPLPSIKGIQSTITHYEKMLSDSC